MILFDYKEIKVKFSRKSLKKKRKKRKTNKRKRKTKKIKKIKNTKRTNQNINSIDIQDQDHDSITKNKRRELKVIVNNELLFDLFI